MYGSLQIIKDLKGKIIISCQAALGEPFYHENAMLAMLNSVVSGGAQGLRLAGERDIANAKKLFKLPIIGITKPKNIPENYKEIVYITPTIKDAKKIIDAGADIVAFDATSRKRNENIADMIAFIQKCNKISMADISTYTEALEARKYGADIVSTTLSGYTKETDHKSSNNRPDFELLKMLVETLDCPVILEGRIWEKEDVRLAFEYGAHAVVIGSAVTRPHEIVKRFLSVVL
jgi:N-acylglucosamine-6-phosphate 2-epimerase